MALSKAQLLASLFGKLTDASALAEGKMVVKPEQTAATENLAEKHLDKLLTMLLPDEFSDDFEPEATTAAITTTKTAADQALRETYLFELLALAKQNALFKYALMRLNTRDFSAEGDNNNTPSDFATPAFVPTGFKPQQTLLSLLRANPHFDNKLGIRLAIIETNNPLLIRCRQLVKKNLPPISNQALRQLRRDLKNASPEASVDFLLGFASALKPYQSNLFDDLIKSRFNFFSWLYLPWIWFNPVAKLLSRKNTTDSFRLLNEINWNYLPSLLKWRPQLFKKLSQPQQSLIIQRFTKLLKPEFRDWLNENFADYSKSLRKCRINLSALDLLNYCQNLPDVNDIPQLTHLIRNHLYLDQNTIQSFWEAFIDSNTNTRWLPLLFKEIPQLFTDTSVKFWMTIFSSPEFINSHADSVVQHLQHNKPLLQRAFPNHADPIINYLLRNCSAENIKNKQIQVLIANNFQKSVEEILQLLMLTSEQRERVIAASRWIKAGILSISRAKNLSAAESPNISSTQLFNLVANHFLSIEEAVKLTQSERYYLERPEVYQLLIEHKLSVKAALEELKHLHTIKSPLANSKLFQQPATQTPASKNPVVQDNMQHPIKLAGAKEHTHLETPAPSTPGQPTPEHLTLEHSSPEYPSRAQLTT